MSEPEAKSDASLKKVLPWLKRLQGALDDDDSSDSSSQPTELTPEKAAEKKPKKEEGEGRRRFKKKRLRRQEDEDSGDESSEGSDDAKEKRRRRLKKSVKAGTVARRKRSAKAAKNEQVGGSQKSPTDSAKAKAAASRQHRMQKLQALRVATGDHERMAVFKLKRQVACEALKKKVRSRMRAVQAARDAQKGLAGTEADVEEKIKQRRPTASRNTADKSAAKRKPCRTAASTKLDNKNVQMDSPVVAPDKSPDSVNPDDKEEEIKVEPCTVAKATPVRPVKPEDKEDGFVTPPEPVKQEDNDANSSAAIKNTSSEPVKTEGNGEPNRASPIPEKTDIKVEVLVNTAEVARKCASPEKPEEMDTTKISLRFATTPNGTPVDPVKPDSKDKVKAEPLDVVEAAPALVKQEDNVEGHAGSPAVPHDAAGPVKNEDGNEKKSRKEDLLLEMMPIPRKVIKEEEPATLSSVESFVIPKRSFAKTDIPGHKAVAQMEKAGTGESRSSVDTSSLDPPVSVAKLPLPSPESSPTLTKMVDSIRPPRKRSKNPVPVKNASLSVQDRALMRLSRKRNSIFMAAAELAAQVLDIRSIKGSTTRMMDYEVYDVDGIKLPDLIPRLSCATKREMASNQESYAASFFGVSLSAPKAKGKASSAVDECGDNELNTRKISCYEELRFDRPEDREFYLRKMYSTTFVPQQLRGWITLIVRNARFERKSTGIRFNQDRDRGEFAASLSKRYTFNNSVPRCDIPRENWQKLMRNQPGTVYLHYYNREDAERASHIFRDDLGHPLELRLDYKAGVVIKKISSAAAGPSPHRPPRRSYSSERSTPEPSPPLSQNGSARDTPSWRREHQPASKSENRYSKYDRSAPPSRAPWSRGERRYDPPVSGNKRSRAMLERRSRSRSRSKSFHSQQNDSGAHESRAGQGRVERIHTQPPMPDVRERTDGGNKSTSSVLHSDADTPARKRAQTLPRSPRRSPTSGQDRSTIEEKTGGDQRGHEDGEVKSRSGVAPINPARTMGGDDGRSGLHRARSPSRRWQQEADNIKASQRRDSFSDYSRDRSSGPAMEHRFNHQQPSRDADERRPRSCSRPGNSSPTRGGRGGNHGDRYKERRGSREFERADAYDSNARERRIHSDRGRGGYNGHRGGADSRPR